MALFIGIVACTNTVRDHEHHSTPARYAAALDTIGGAVAAMIPPVGAAALPWLDRLDGLLLSGSPSNVAPALYGAAEDLTPGEHDPARDATTLPLIRAAVARGLPVLGICRGLQEINVLFGGSLSAERCRGHHHGGAERDYARLFEHRHDVELACDGRLAAATGARRLTVNSVHEQAIDRLGIGLEVEALSAGDGVVEAIAARPCGAEVLAVQWHPEWDVATSAASRSFFGLIGAALRA